MPPVCRGDHSVRKPIGPCASMRQTLLVTALISLSACATANDEIANEYCDIALPMTFVTSDDEETKRQIEQHNAVYMWICEGVRIIPREPESSAYPSQPIRYRESGPQMSIRGRI